MPLPKGEFIPLTGRRAEAALHNFILDECIDDEVLLYLLPSGQPNAWESALWDYKRHLPITSGRGAPEDKAKAQAAIAELVKDVVAFHNAYGGYILAGIDQHAHEPVVGCSNLGPDGFTVEKLNAQVRSYTRTRISCRFRSIPIGNGKSPLGLLLVPMRRPEEPIVRMSSGSPERGKDTPAFRKGDIFARIDDACKPVQADVQGLQFVCSPRLFGSEISRMHQAENNLPPKDPNLIRFVGRADYLLELWSWLTDRHTPVKILTALGGTGKTTIAFEFCRQLIASPPAWINKVIWLTAKKQAFSAIQEQYIGATRTDYETPDEFFAALASELGYSRSDVNVAADRPELLDLVLDGLRMFPSLVVVDDIDSLDLAQQADLFSTVQVLAGRTFEGGSRFLFTSRLELSAGDNQRIKVRGFAADEFAEYAKMIASERGLKLDDGVIYRMHRASLGSPIFCASILRLVSLGADINSAIARWKDREGEDVRRFAFERELEELTDSEARTLFALSALGETTQLELKQVLNIDDAKITRDLAKLREFHLFASRGDPSTGTKLEVPEPIRLMSSILRDRTHDPVRIEKECARARNQLPKVHDKIAVAIAAILSLWKNNEYEAALFSARQAQKDNPRSGDINCILGQCHLKITPAKPDEADKAFRRAHSMGCARPELVPNWLEAKRLSRDWNGIVDVGKAVPPSEIRSQSAVVVIDAMLELARQRAGRGDYVRAAAEIGEAMFAASQMISHGRAGDQIVEVRERCRLAAQHYVHWASLIYDRPGDRIDVFNAVVDAFRCHVTETWMIDLALESISTWTADVGVRSQPDLSALEILRRRLLDLGEIRRHIDEMGPSRRPLFQRIMAVENRLEGKLRVLTSKSTAV